MAKSPFYLPRAELLNLIRRKYPKGSEKVSTQFAAELLSGMQHALNRSGPRPGVADHAVSEMLGDIYTSAKRGMTASELYSRAQSFFERMDASRYSDRDMMGMERRLRELSALVSQSAGAEQKYEELQSQIERMRFELADRRPETEERKEDALQKFLASDKKAFIIMPFERALNNVWLGAIKAACSDQHFAPLRVDEISLSSLITSDIEQYSNMADVVIVDVTGNNPNVMFEFGWALAKSKHPIAICQGEFAGKVAFDVRGIRHITYENSWLGVEELKHKLKEFLSTTDKQRVRGASKPRKKAKKSP